MFYECLEHLCRQRNETVSSVVKSLGLSTSKVTAWKNGSCPNGIILTKLADYLDCSVDYLLGRTNNPSSLSDETLDRYELELLTGFRSMSEQGKEYILETIAMAKERYKKDTIFTELKKEIN